MQMELVLSDYCKSLEHFDEWGNYGQRSLQSTEIGIFPEHPKIWPQTNPSRLPKKKKIRHWCWEIYADERMGVGHSMTKKLKHEQLVAVLLMVIQF